MPTIKDIKQIEFLLNGGHRGSLVAAESNKHIPFVIKRIFYTFGVDNSIARGQHANRESEFVMVCVSGSCKVKVTDSTGAEAVYTLDKPESAIYVPEMTWKELYNFSSDCVLLTIANTPYIADEYICDFEEFLKEGADA
jgi:dTDP-4-dehydrorhamnose 3,5-epimerase-like enzyme